MKKILLASTILVGTAGFAAADNANFTFSGSAYVGAGYETAGGVFDTPERRAELEKRLRDAVFRIQDESVRHRFHRARRGPPPPPARSRDEG